MPNAWASARRSADRRAASVSSEHTNADRKNSCPRTASSNCWCSTMSQPCANRNAVTACTMPGRCGQLKVRMKVRGIAVSSISAFDDVDGEAAARRLLVLVLHVGPGVAHRLDRLVQGHEVLSIA